MLTAALFTWFAWATVKVLTTKVPTFAELPALPAE